MKINYNPEKIKIQITKESIKPINDDKFTGNIFNSSNYKIYILKDENTYVYVGKTKQGVGTKFGQGFSAYLKDIKGETKQSGYAGYKWIKKYINTSTELELLVFDLGNDNNNEYTEAIEAEIVHLIRNRYNMWPSCQNEIHFNNDFDDALGKAIRIFNVVEDIKID